MSPCPHVPLSLFPSRAQKIFLICSVLIIQHPVVLPYSYHFRNYSVKDGLPFIHVYTIYQDSRGYLWTGGYGGLSRFDGKNFTNFAPKDGLANHWITSIVEDRKGVLWIGTIRGLNKYIPGNSGFDGESFVKYNISNGLPGNRINHLFIDHQGYLWCATNNGVCRFDDNSTLVYNIASGLVSDSCEVIFQDRKGNMWFGTKNGITLFDGKTFRNFTDENGLIGKFVHDFLEEPSGKIWIGTTEGICRFDGTRFELPASSSGKKIKNITSLEENPFGTGFWVGTTTGLYLYDGTDFISYPVRGSSNSRWIECLFTDYEKNLWIGTYAGLYKYRGNAFHVYSEEDGILNNFIFPVIRDHDGNLWVGTTDGLYMQQGDTFLQFTGKNGLPGNTINSIIQDNKNHLWITTDNGILKCLPGYFFKKPPPFEVFTEKDGLISTESFTLFPDSRGNIWIGGKNGLSLFEQRKVVAPDGNKFKSFSFSKGMEELSVRCFAEDSNGFIYAGAYNGGLFRWNDTGFVDFGAKIGLQTNTVLALICDENNNLWIGSLDGVFFYDGKKIFHINEGNGLNSDLVYSMIMDEGETRLWIGTNQGLNKMDIPEFLHNGKLEIEHYGEEEGFYGVECNPGVFLDKDGSKWFATVNGLIKFSPGEYFKNLLEPKLHLTALKIHYKDTSGFSILPWYLNHISFAFTGICFTNPKKVLYSFRLENYDREWSPPSQQNTATYSNLPPGKYVFKVKSCNNENIWNSRPMEYSFVITSPFWKTNGFRVLLFVSALAIIMVIFYLRLQRIRFRIGLQRKMDELKLHALRAQMNPHFIFNALNAIQHYINANERRQANDYLSKFADLIRTILENSGKESVTLADDLKALELYIHLEELRFENRFEYSIFLSQDIDAGFLHIPPMIIQPFVENAIMHGLLNLETCGFMRKGKVSVTVSYRDDFIRCVVEDNGVGRKKTSEMKSASASGHHHPMGLNITRQRMETLGKLNRKFVTGIRVTDLFDDKGTSAGTQVELDIPVVEE
ncbi:MAG: histidine kinase [Bacteroidetes bacterium]|nr:histidine kinase [Bacteroidota bacterium]